ncbi:GSCOCG00010220001-RA-CDS [Cotesia congregata]|nr:GSCOCG00010220001-RA-CDS [Cotesia congregata]
MQVSTLKINKVCRICLTETNDLILLLINQEKTEYPGILEKIQECGGVQLSEEYGTPIFICNNCIDNTKIAYKFRLQCQYSETKLRLLHEKFIQQRIQVSHHQQNLTETSNSSTGSQNSSKLIIDEVISTSEDGNCLDVPLQTDEVKKENKKVDDGSSISDQFERSDAGSISENKCVKRKYNRKKIQCQRCSEIFISQETLAHHLFNNHGEKYKCLWCPETFDTLKLMKSHKVTHDLRDRRRRRSYSRCSNESANGATITVNKKKFRSLHEDNYDHQLCIDNNNDDKSNSSTNTVNFVENEDYQEFNKKDSNEGASKSSRTANNQSIGSENSQVVEKNYGPPKATTGDIELNDGKNIKKSKICYHKIRLKNFILHKCEICRRKFENIRKLNRHIRNHISKHICNLCNQAFVSQRKVDKHKKKDHCADKIDIDESRICFFCNKVFASSHQRFKHEKKVHWELEK